MQIEPHLEAVVSLYPREVISCLIHRVPIDAHGTFRGKVVPRDTEGGKIHKIGACFCTRDAPLIFKGRAPPVVLSGPIVRESDRSESKLVRHNGGKDMGISATILLMEISELDSPNPDTGPTPYKRGEGAQKQPVYIIYTETKH